MPNMPTRGSIQNRDSSEGEKEDAKQSYHKVDRNFETNVRPICSSSDPHTFNNHSAADGGEVSFAMENWLYETGYEAPWNAIECFREMGEKRDIKSHTCIKSIGESKDDNATKQLGTDHWSSGHRYGGMDQK
ncbi:hypothetical protein MMC20_001705 [Loxospora ochrophaea]|nr:hypothetical protein [Loxospora ochrophaea]